MSDNYSPGDQIDLYQPPQHCGATMDVWKGNSSAYEVVCREDDFEVHTDDNGNVIR